MADPAQAKVTITEITPEDIKGPRDFELLKIAAEFIETERYDFAVLAIQTAVELYVEERLQGILRWRNLGPLGDVILEHLEPPPYNFMSQSFRRLWTSLTRDSITAAKDLWKAYTCHVERRNGVAHRGEHVDEAGAWESLHAAGDLMNHVNWVYIRTGERLGKLWGVGTKPRPDPDPY